MKNIEKKLFTDIEELIKESRNKVAISVNQVMSNLYWNIGKEIKNTILDNQKPDYGKQIVENLSTKLLGSYGRGYNKEREINKLYKLFCVFVCSQTNKTLPQKRDLYAFITLLRKRFIQF